MSESRCRSSRYDCSVARDGKTFQGRIVDQVGEIDGPLADEQIEHVGLVLGHRLQMTLAPLLPQVQGLEVEVHGEQHERQEVDRQQVQQGPAHQFATMALLFGPVGGEEEMDSLCSG